MSSNTLLQIGPFTQVLTLSGLPKAGPITDEALQVIENAWIVVQGTQITDITTTPARDIPTDNITTPAVATPGLVDAHTHICFGGSRARDYALRVAGTPYQEIAARGGGILDTLRQTRAATEDELRDGMLKRLDLLAAQGITTVEVKSGYGLNVDDELKMLRAIQGAAADHPLAIAATCLAAHMMPPEAANHDAYLEYIKQELLPIVLNENLASRVDIFVEQGAFSIDQARSYLSHAKKMGFALTVHADQFSRGGALLAAELGCLSVDHLEQSDNSDFAALQRSGTIPVMLPGATLGLGMPFPHARKALDAGLPLAIASDWNPGSAPMGQLLTQAALLGAAETLTMAETWAAITQRAARALDLKDRGMLLSGQRADLVVWPTGDWREILYHQGAMTPSMTFVGGKKFAGRNVLERAL